MAPPKYIFGTIWFQNSAERKLPPLLEDVKNLDMKCFSMGALPVGKCLEAWMR